MRSLFLSIGRVYKDGRENSLCPGLEKKERERNNNHDEERKSEERRLGRSALKCEERERELRGKERERERERIAE